MDLKDITILLWDTEENFLNHKFNWGIYKNKSRLYEDVVQFQTEEQLKNALSKLTIDSKIVFCCHVAFGDQNSGYHSFKASQIEVKFNIPNVYYLSSAGDVAETKLRSEGERKVNVRQYTEIREDIILQKIRPFTLKDLEKTTNAPNENEDTKQLIFLSHSFKDKEIVHKFMDVILVQGLGYNINQIKFSSSPITGTRAGTNIMDSIKDALLNTGLFIQFLSEDFEKSRLCLNEEGAAWILLDEEFFIPVVLDSSEKEVVPWARSLNNYISIDDDLSLKRLFLEDLGPFFKSDTLNILNFTTKVEEFVAWYKTNN